MLLNINYLNLSINNYAGLGGWGIKVFVCLYPKEIAQFQWNSNRKQQIHKLGVQFGCAQK